MALMACVNLPQFPLQVLLNLNPKWHKLPVVVVSELLPQGRVLYANKHAKKAYIEPQMSYGEALAGVPELKAATISMSQIRTKLRLLYQLIFEQFCPNIEPSIGENRFCIWLHIQGLDRLFGSYHQWVKDLFKALRDKGYFPSICIGSNPVRTYAISQIKPLGYQIFEDPKQEQKAYHALPLSSLQLPEKEVLELNKLGIGTLSQLLKLPYQEVCRRFGTEIQALHQQSMPVL